MQMDVNQATSKSDSGDSNQHSVRRRNFISFLILGLCNNYAFVLMLSGAQDILSKDSADTRKELQNDTCLQDLSTRHCTQISTGLVLICNILPSLVIKGVAPFFVHYIPYGVRLIIIILVQAMSLLVAALAPNVPLTLFGVLLASFSSGFGEMSLVQLASHFHRNTILGWSSGTGLAGLAGSLIYAVLTDSRLFGFSPSTTLLLNLVVPLIFLITYFYLLVHPSTVQKASLSRPSSWLNFESNKKCRNKITPSNEEQANANTMRENDAELSRTPILRIVIKFWIAIFVIYFSQYFINQGLLELTLFDCSHGFGIGPAAMYRYYQFIYQVGVFISRSSLSIIQLNLCLILTLPLMQAGMMVLFATNTLVSFLPHFAVAAALVLFEGLIAGSSYCNIYNHIYKSYDIASREKAVAYVASADGFGILLAAISSIPAHNAICNLPMRQLWN